MEGGQMKTTNIPIIVDGFRLGYDAEPTWFKEAIEKRDIIKFDEGVFISTDVGKLYIEPGYYVLRDMNGSYFLCSQETFSSIIDRSGAI